MGQWTAAHYDNVLNAKIKSLVSGAIKRSKIEDNGPVISYESFVEDLDAGDSFTTSVIEILVKEMAERRSRNCTSSNDKRLIASRTAKNLRNLALPMYVYRGSSSLGSHSSRPLARNLGRRMSEYLSSSPPTQMDGFEDDDLEFDSVLEQAQGFEGVRMNSELYDAYGAGHSSWTTGGLLFRRSRTSSPTPPPLDSTSPTQSPPPNTTSPLVPGVSSLARQASIRRAPRSRTVDFNDFTSRRRSTLRDSARGESSNPADHTEPSSSIRPNPWRPSSSRRFFPFSSRHPRNSDNIPSSSSTSIHPSWLFYDNPEDRTDPSRQPTMPTAEPSPSSPAWYAYAVPPRDDMDEAETSDERTTVSGAPRLRRGGVRAPESIAMRRQALPSSIIRLPLSPDLSDSSPDSIVPVTGADVVSYPTPGSPPPDPQLGSENPSS